MCTSVARSSMASVRIWLTKRMMEAPSAASVRSMSSSDSVSMTCRPFSPASEIIDWTVSAPTPRYRLMQRSISASGARAIWKSRPVASRSSSIAEVSKGLLVTASSSPFVPFDRHDVLVQEDAGGELREKLLRERAGFELDERPVPTREPGTAATARRRRRRP